MRVLLCITMGMFESLTGQLSKIFSKLSRKKNLTEANISEALLEVKKALLFADVEYTVVNQFIDDIKKQCIGQKIFENVEPGQQVIKVVHDKLVEILGAEASTLSDKKPLKILMVGLHGSGKTTSTVKLAHFFKKNGRLPALVACDIYRPAAVEQLKILAQQIDVPVYHESNTSVTSIASSALGWFKKQTADVLLFDTAGRLQIDKSLIDEILKLKKLIEPDETLLVADSALGQEAVNVARTFHELLQLTGLILTKLDGDTKGGAALSMKRAIDVPIKFAAIGEKLEDFERFYPERMAGRILGMGDIVSLVEKAQSEVGEEDMEALGQRMFSKDFNFEDFLAQLGQMKKMGSVSSLSKWLPGLPHMKLGAEQDEEFKRIESMILSMTIKERQQPNLLNSTQRRLRIARGAGLPISEFNKLLKRFQSMKKMMQQLRKTKPSKLQEMMQSFSLKDRFNDRR